MMPPDDQQRFFEFRQALEQSLQRAREGANGVELKAILSQLQQQFQTQILSLNLEQLTPEWEQKGRSIQVEMDKQLRLLGMDILFLQAARQADTQAQRQQQILERFHTLKRYCSLMLEEEGSGAEVQGEGDA